MSATVLGWTCNCHTVNKTVYTHRKWDCCTQNTKSATRTITWIVTRTAEYLCWPCDNQIATVTFPLCNGRFFLVLSGMTSRICAVCSLQQLRLGTRSCSGCSTVSFLRPSSSLFLLDISFFRRLALLHPDFLTSFAEEQGCRIVMQLHLNCYTTLNVTFILQHIFCRNETCNKIGLFTLVYANLSMISK